MPERPVSVPISYKSFDNLMDKLNYSESEKYKISIIEFFLFYSELLMIFRYPRYYFDASRSTMVIQCMPSPVHESLPQTFARKFLPIMTTLPAAVQSRIDVHYNLDIVRFTGRYIGSQKKADLHVSFSDEEANSNITLVFEVGFTESYEDLTRNARLWLEGMISVRVVVLAKFQESPVYKNPLRKEDEETLRRLDNTSAVKPSNFTMLGEYGPFTYGGFTWAGRISEAFIEIWRRNPTTGVVERREDRMVSELL